MGIDEAGRGALAGPVTAACVVFSPPVTQFSGFGIKDSKLLTPEKRESLSIWVFNNALCSAVGWASKDEVDRLNIRQATLLAMRRAIHSLPLEFLEGTPLLFAFDGKDILPDFPYPQVAIIGGDRIVLSIAAASILAKVARDRYMNDIDAHSPEYHFANHKGYGTEEHRRTLQQFGISPYHRVTFCRKILSI